MADKKQKRSALLAIDAGDLVPNATTTPRDNLASFQRVEEISRDVPTSSLDGKGLATEKPGHWNMEDVLRAPLDAIKSEMFTYDVLRWAFGDTPAVDPQWKWTAESVAEYTDGVDPEHVDYILEAESAEEAQQRRRRIEELLESRENLSNLGSFGSALGLTAGIIDPVTWLGGGVGALAKGGRLARMAKGGLYASATTGAQFATFGALSPVEDEADVLTALAMTWALGTAVGGIAGRSNRKAALAAHDASVRADVDGMARRGFSLTATGRHFYEQERARFRSVFGIDEDLPSGGPFGASTAGAAESNRALDTLRTDPITGQRAFDELESVEDAPFSFGGLLRLDVVGKLRQSLNPAVREMARRLDIDSVGVSSDGSANMLGTAAERQRRHIKTTLGEASVELSKIYRGYAERQGWGVLASFRNRGDFYKRMVEYLRSRGELPDPGGDLAQAAAVWKSSMQKGLQRLREAGVDGADRFEPDDWYVPRQWKSAKIEAAIAKFGQEKVEALLAASMRSAWRKGESKLPRLTQDINGDNLKGPQLGNRFDDDLDELEPDKADRIAKAMLGRIRRLGAGIDAHGLDAARHTRAQLDDLLEEAGLDAAERQRILDRIAPQKDSANFSRLKNRTTLDDGYEEMVAPREGGPAERLSINDLLEDDGSRILASYHSGVGSYAAMSELGIQSFGQFERLVQGTKAHVGVVKDYTAAMAEADVRRLTYLGKRIFGVPVEDISGTGARVGKMLRDVNFGRNMGQSGAANLPDIAVIIAETGMRTVKAHLPDAWRTMNAIRKGEDIGGLDRELSTLLGVGRHGKRDELVPAYEDLDEMMTMHSSQADWLGKVSQYAETSARLVGKYSGFNFINDFLQVTAARASTQQIADLVRGVKKFNTDDLPVPHNPLKLEQTPAGTLPPDQKLSPQREAAWGITPEDKEAWSNLFERAEFDKNGTILRMNYEKMREADPAAFQRLVDYLDRRVHTMVLEPTPGMLHEAFGTTVGKIFLQFRAFPFASTFSHAMQGIALKDREAALKLVYGMTTAGLVYALQTHVRSIGRSDRQEYLDKRLAPVEIAKAAFQRSASAGLIPGLADTAWGFASHDPIFSYGRTSELASGVFAGNPTVDLVSDTYNSLAAPGQSAFSGERQYSEGDARTAASVLPFQNMWGIQNALQIATSMFPETREQEGTQQ